MVITLKNSIQNTSLQVGDIIYCVSFTGGGPVDSDGDEIFASHNPDDFKEIGPVISINVFDIEVPDGPTVPQPGNGDFLMFSKDKRANNTRLKGYYAEVKLMNDSVEKAELFTLGAEMTPSSK